MTPEEITKGSTLLATLESEFKFESEDLINELHSMIQKAIDYNKIFLHNEVLRILKSDPEISGIALLVKIEMEYFEK